MKNDYSITIETSHYDESVNGGKMYYSVWCTKNFGSHSGSGSPCDTKEEVIKTITGFLKEQETDEFYDNHRPPTKNNTSLENSVGELRHITLDYLFAKTKGYEQKSLRFLMAKTES